MITELTMNDVDSVSGGFDVDRLAEGIGIVAAAAAAVPAFAAAAPFLAGAAAGAGLFLIYDSFSGGSSGGGISYASLEDPTRD